MIVTSKLSVIWTKIYLIKYLMIRDIFLNEITSLEEVLDSVDLPKFIQVKADKGYQSKKNKELLQSR